MPRAKQFGVIWSDEEKHVLRKAFTKGGLKAARKALPHRGKSGVARMTYILKLTRTARRWTEEEHRRLRRMWGFCTMDEICKILNRPTRAVWCRAIILGLKPGAPPGWEPIGHAAKRAGYDSVTMKRILIWAGVDMPRAYTPSRNCKRQRRIVQPCDVDDAVEEYVKTEAIETAARRTGMSRTKLIAILRRHGVKSKRSPRSPKSHRRILPSDVDAAIVAEEKQRSRRITLSDAATLVGVSRSTLGGWIRKHGIQKKHRREPIDRRDIDRIVAAEMSRGDKRVVIGSKKPAPPKLAA